MTSVVMDVVCKRARDRVPISCRPERVSPSTTTTYILIITPNLHCATLICIASINHAMTSGADKPHIYPEYCHELSPSIKRWCPLRAVDVHDLADRGMFNNGKLHLDASRCTITLNLCFHCHIKQTFNANKLLFLGRRLYHHGNHPVKWVRLTGLIVAVDAFASKRIYTLDDSSGMCIECVCPAPRTAAEVAIAAATSTVVVTKKSDKPKDAAPTGPSVTDPNVPWDEMDVGVVVKIKGGINTFRDQKQVEIIKVEILKSTDQEVRCWNEVLEFRKEVLRVPWVLTKEQEDKCRRRAIRESSRVSKSSSRKPGGVRDKRLERVKGEKISRSRQHASGERSRGSDENRNRFLDRNSTTVGHRTTRPPEGQDEAKRKVRTDREPRDATNHQQDVKHRHKV
jgi:hypothetical protein